MQLNKILGRLAISLACLAPMAGASAATGATGATESTPRAGGTLTYLIAVEPTALVSLFNPKVENRNISAKVTEGLLRYDLSFKPQPLLATEWKLSDDGLRYTFKLRRGVKFHDGSEFTSADVKYSIQTQRETGARGRITFANVKEIQTPDAHTVVIVLAKPAPYLLRALSSAETPIVPHQRYAQGDPLANDNNSNPVGTGPFRFKEWVKGSHVVLEKNPNYWRAGHPYLDRVIYRFIKNPASISAALEAGEANVAQNVAISDLDRLAKNPSLAINDSYDEFLSNVLFLEFNLDNPILSNVKVRQALALAIDRNFIANTVYYKRAQVVNSSIPSVLSNYYDDRTFNVPFDVARANALLDEAGYPRKGNEGRFPLPLRLVFMPSADFKRTAEYVRAALNRVGVKVEIIDGDLPTFITRVYKERGFDLTVNGLGRLFDPTVGVQRLYWSDGIKNPLPFVNAPHYNNPQVDELFRAAAVETDDAKRAKLFKDIQVIVGRDLPSLPLVTVPSALQIYQKRVHALNNSIDLTAGDFSDTWIDQ